VTIDTGAAAELAGVAVQREFGIVVIRRFGEREYGPAQRIERQALMDVLAVKAKAQAIRAGALFARADTEVILQELLGLAVFFKPDHLAIGVTIGDPVLLFLGFLRFLRFLRAGPQRPAQHNKDQVAAHGLRTGKPGRWTS
jgi:hypothetical protein